MSRSVTNKMGMSRVLRWSPLAAVLALAACTSVLGIEDLHDGPRPGAGGDDSSGGTNTTGGKNHPSGGSVTAAGSSPDAGANPGTGGTNGGSNNNTAGTAGTTVNDAGAGGAPIDGDSAVHGHVVDFWGHKLANVPVQIGDTLTATDENGAFVIENVAATYEVSLAFEVDTSGFPRLFGWVFQGLTRRDPTLQVIRGLSIRYGNVLLTPKDATVDTNQTIAVALGGADGNTNFSSVGTNGLDTSATWEGGDTSQQSAHAVYYQYDATSELPTSYLAYNTSLVALAETGKANISLSLPKGTLDAGNLQGTATSGGGTDRENRAFLRFTSGAALRLIDDNPGPNTFSYLLPNIPNSTITIAASEGSDDVYGPYALVHADGLTTTSKPALKIPTPCTLTSPASETTGVNATTKFSFTNPTSNTGPFVVRFTNVDDNGPYQTLWVVTAQKQLTIPVVTGGGFKLRAGQMHSWNVTTHGKFASVDAMAGPKGFLDPFGAESEPVGPVTTGGELTISSSRSFTTAP